MRLLLPVFCIICISFNLAFGQNPTKKLIATRTTQTIKIDGSANEEAWKSAPEARDFIEFRPAPGRKEREGQTTSVKILYDDVAVYVFARMNENNADSIAKQIAPRDQVGNADFIGVIFDTYYDKINASGFYVTSAGSQYDAKYSQSGNEDGNWSAVWFSEVKLDNKGWSAEMKIPFSALRFSSKAIQNWGINFTRKRQKINQQFFWSPVDPKQSGFINQEGELDNLENIKAPLRLSFTPYVSSYVNNYPVNTPGIKNTTSTLNGGMDVKYGINDAFTLDLTLVPDFGQVQSDNLILNLGPFETRYDEKRQFFTEGTELFNKGDLFYSRRVGLDPAFSTGGTAKNEVFLSNPSQGKLINATKISGRTSSKLGIGFFNAVTNQMFSAVRDTITGQERTFTNQPLTNYNILVLDQSLKNNSSVSFINTNVLRQGAYYDANVSAFLFNINNKSNKFFLKGSGKMSYLKGNEINKDAEAGYSYNLNFGKQSGTFTWTYEQELTDVNYNPGDLGYYTNSNYFNQTVNLGYNIYKPTTWYNEWQTYASVNYSNRFKKSAFQSFGINGGSYMRFKNLWSANINLDWDMDGNDFYEPRLSGYVYKNPATRGINLNVNSNNAKKYSGGVSGAYRERDIFNGRGFSFGFYQNLRLTDKFSLNTDFSTDPRFDYAGFAGFGRDYQGKITDVIFSRYDRRTIEAIVGAKYTFSPRMGITLRLRNYWSDRKNQEFFTLLNDGSLEKTSIVLKNSNQNYNTFNVDMIYTWVFSPGSELSVAYKDASQYANHSILPDYGRNFNQIINTPQNNNLSVKLLYYIDYLNLKKLKF